MSEYIFKILLFTFWSLPVFGQVDKFAPTSIRVGGEAASFGYSLFKDDFKSWEVEGDVDFYRYFLVFDWGYNSFFQASDQITYGYFNYKSSGRYFRVGPDINFIRNERTKNVLALGLRYGQSNFKESADYSTYNAVENETTWPEDTLSYSEGNITGRWMEMNASLKARIFKNLYLGLTIRYKILPGGSKEGTFQTYYLPGFGKIINKNNWGLSYYISYRFPFREKKRHYFIKEEKK